MLPVTGSNTNLTASMLNSIPPHTQAKRSTLEEAGGTQLQEGSKYRLQQVNGLHNRGSVAGGPNQVGSAAVPAPPGMMLSSTLAEAFLLGVNRTELVLFHLSL